MHHELTIQNYQRDALNIIYSSNITLLYMFRISSTHLQEDTVVHEQHMVPSFSIRVLVSCWYAAIGRTWVLDTWYSKHVEESNIWRINNIKCITLVVLYGQSHSCNYVVPKARSFPTMCFWFSGGDCEMFSDFILEYVTRNLLIVRKYAK